MLHQIEIAFLNQEDATEILSLAERYDEIEAIHEKNFTGDVTTIELYVSVAVNVLALVSSTVTSLIAKKKTSSVKIDGEKIEVTNVSEELIKQIVESKLGVVGQDNSDAQ